MKDLQLDYLMKGLYFVLENIIDKNQFRDISTNQLNDTRGGFRQYMTEDRFYKQVKKESIKLSKLVTDQKFKAYLRNIVKKLTLMSHQTGQAGQPREVLRKKPPAKPAPGAELSKRQHDHLQAQKLWTRVGKIEKIFRTHFTKTLSASKWGTEIPLHRIATKQEYQVFAKKLKFASEQRGEPLGLQLVEQNKEYCKR